mmetsp:Transcript_39669/g.114133  ORF Transcript_39669/g.114133 Transcript_39669/m.114133 type:complete len:200 (-) Transcript_39669:9-608(-)
MPATQSSKSPTSPVNPDTKWNSWLKRMTPARAGGISNKANSCWRNAIECAKPSAPTVKLESIRNTMSTGSCAPCTKFTATCGSVCAAETCVSVLEPSVWRPTVTTRCVMGCTMLLRCSCRHLTATFAAQPPRPTRMQQRKPKTLSTTTAPGTSSCRAQRSWARQSPKAWSRPLRQSKPKSPIGASSPRCAAHGVVIAEP